MGGGLLATILIQRIKLCEQDAEKRGERKEINGWYRFNPIADPPVTICSPQTIFHERHTQTSYK
jgi:hypothetical protein